jgi:hypothetical protein
MFSYTVEEVRSIIKNILKANTTPDAFAWLEEKRPLNTAFVLLPRKTGKAMINISPEQTGQLNTLIPGFSVEGWSVDRLGRAYLLLSLDATDKSEYFRVIENLFLAAEMGELVALYSALPLLAYPEIWVKRCSEGIRSNIGSVLEAIMYQNPYPAQNLDQNAWNQLVLKAFFTDKEVGKIIGIDTRANKDLAYLLSDYAHERWAAKRQVNPNLWRLVGKFIDDKLFADIQRLFDDGTLIDRKAGALAIAQTDYQPAKTLLIKYPELVTAIENKNLSWDTLTGN